MQYAHMHYMCITGVHTCMTSDLVLKYSWRTNISYLDFGLKPAVASCLTNAIVSPPIALESCSRVQTDQTVFYFALEKIFWLGVADFL